jgi:hypothetical protein
MSIQEIKLPSLALNAEKFLMHLSNGEPGIMAIFEERPRGYTERVGTFQMASEYAEPRVEMAGKD